MSCLRIGESVRFLKKLVSVTMAGSRGQFLRTERGRLMLCSEGYLYTKHRTNDHLVIWRYTRRTCRVGMAATPAGLVIEVRSLHNHVVQNVATNFEKGF